MTREAYLCFAIKVVDVDRVSIWAKGIDLKRTARSVQSTFVIFFYLRDTAPVSVVQQGTLPGSK